eukprot:6116934-Prymnesium_polylepis.1
MARRSCPDRMIIRSKSGVSGFNLELGIFVTTAFPVCRCGNTGDEERESERPQHAHHKRCLQSGGWQDDR